MTSISQQVVITGHIINLSKNNRTVQIKQNHIVFGPISSSGIADSTGYFKFELEVDYPQTVLLKYCNNTWLYCEPGDSIYVKLDGDIYTNYTDMPNGEYFVREVGGSNAQTNNCIIDFLLQEPNRVSNLKYAYKHADARKNYSPNEYKSFIAERDSMYLSYYTDFSNNKQITPKFQSFAKEYIRYMYLYDLMIYPLYPREDSPNQQKIILPDDYYSFLEKYDMNDSLILSYHHADFFKCFNYACSQ